MRQSVFSVCAFQVQMSPKSDSTRLSLVADWRHLRYEHLSCRVAMPRPDSHMPKRAMHDYSHGDKQNWITRFRSITKDASGRVINRFFRNMMHRPANDQLRKILPALRPSEVHRKDRIENFEHWRREPSMNRQAFGHSACPAVIGSPAHRLRAWAAALCPGSIATTSVGGSNLWTQ